MRKKIEKILLEMGVPASVKGFDFITEAVMLLNENPFMQITKELYPAIAKKHETIGARVERAIRHAFEIARSARGNFDTVEHYIGFVNCTNAASLKMLCITIKNECEAEGFAKRTLNFTQETDEDKIRQIVREEFQSLLDIARKAVV